VAVLAAALSAGRVEQLLDGLAESVTALRCARETLQLRSSERHARLELWLGPRSDREELLRSLLPQLGSGLRGELLRRLPAFYQSVLPLPPPVAGEPSVALRAMARRLAHEASR
jgi:hypothetical protein